MIDETPLEEDNNKFWSAFKINSANEIEIKFFYDVIKVSLKKYYNNKNILN